MENTARTIVEIFTDLEETKLMYSEGLIDKTDALTSMMEILTTEVIANSKDNRRRADYKVASVERLRKIQEIMLCSELE